MFQWYGDFIQAKRLIDNSTSLSSDEVQDILQKLPSVTELITQYQGLSHIRKFIPYNQDYAGGTLNCLPLNDSSHLLINLQDEYLDSLTLTLCQPSRSNSTFVQGHRIGQMHLEDYAYQVDSKIVDEVVYSCVRQEKQCSLFSVDLDEISTVEASIEDRLRESENMSEDNCHKNEDNSQKLPTSSKISSSRKDAQRELESRKKYDIPQKKVLYKY